MQTAEPSCCSWSWSWGWGKERQGARAASLSHSSPSLWGSERSSAPGPPTTLHAIPPATLPQPGAAHVYSVAPRHPHVAPQPPVSRPSTHTPSPAHLAVLDEANEMFKAIVAEEGGLEHWPVLAGQHHGDGVCGGVEGQSCPIPSQQYLQSALNLPPCTAQSNLPIVTWAFTSQDHLPKNLGVHTHRAC